MARLVALLLLTLVLLAVVVAADSSKTVIIGGHGEDGSAYLRNADIISDGTVSALPDLPFGIGHNTAFVHGGKIYTCGGKNGTSEYVKQCLTLDLPVTSGSSWKFDVTLPVATSFQPMVVVEDSLWILKNTKVYVVPLNGDRTTEHSFDSYLTVEEHSCGGFDGSSRYVMNKGSYKIWRNTDAKKPGKWILWSNDGNVSEFGSCMLTESHFYVTGGWSEYGGYNKYTERVSLSDGVSESMEDMVLSRGFHGMGKVNGEIAVIGGYNGKCLDSIEVYKEAEKKWTLIEMKMSSGVVNEMGFATFA